MRKIVANLFISSSATQPLCFSGCQMIRASGRSGVRRPSLPGYGFSDEPATSGWGIERIAPAWAALIAPSIPRTWSGWRARRARSKRRRNRTRADQSPS